MGKEFGIVRGQGLHALTVLGLNEAVENGDYSVEFSTYNLDSAIMYLLSPNKENSTLHKIGKSDKIIGTLLKEIIGLSLEDLLKTGYFDQEVVVFPEDVKEEIRNLVIKGCKSAIINSNETYFNRGISESDLEDIIY